MKFDMHCHTKEGSIDAKVSIMDYACQLIRMGFDGMLVTDHNSYRGYEKWAEAQKKRGVLKNFTVLKGIEYDTVDAGHIIAILPDGVHSKLLEIRGMTIHQLERIVHGLGGILGPAHPYGTGYFAAMNTHPFKKNEKLMEKFDFIEVFNSCTKPLANAKARLLATKYDKFNFAGSDAHKAGVIGKAYTIFENKITCNNDLIRAVKHKEKVVAQGIHIDKVKKEMNTLDKVKEELGIIGYWCYNRLSAFIMGSRRYIELQKTIR